MNVTPLPTAPAARDLGPLAWVMDELRRTLDDAVAAVTQFVADNEAARHTDLAEVDTTGLRMVRQQVHQAVGALEMVGLAAAAQTLRALEAALQRLVQRPATATPAAAEAVQHGAWALVDFLHRTVRDRALPDVALFPTYRDWQALAGVTRVHPAELWRFEPVAQPMPPSGKAYVPGPQVRAHLDRLVLMVVKALSPQAAAPLVQLTAGLSRGSPDPAVAQFWLAAAAYFEAVAHGLLPDNVYVKRAASSILLQYTHVSQGELQGLPALTHELWFLASQAVPPEGLDLPHLTAVWQAHGWQAQGVLDCETRWLGLFDPAALAAAVQAVAATQRSWALWTDGDASALLAAARHMGPMAQHLQALGAHSAGLAAAWTEVAQACEASAEVALPQGVALEVANSLLFLGAELEDFDPLDPGLPERHQALAERLDAVLNGQAAPAAAPWMAQVYQRLSERQTLGHLVAQLQGELQAVESALDALFRRGDADALAALAPLPAQVEAMRGVVAMLGLPAADAALAAVHQVLLPWIPPNEAPTPDALTEGAAVLAPNLSALGSLLDTFARQPELARERFVFDADARTLRSLLVAPVRIDAAGIESEAPHTEAFRTEAPSGDAPSAEASAPEAVPVELATPLALAEPDEDDGAELLAIFTEEAAEVFAGATATLHALRDQPDRLADLTALRRAFHTLKGSARMVGLADLGEAAWAMEQLLNTWLADQQPASADLLELCEQALARLQAWVQALVAGQTEAEGGASGPIRASADALRLEGVLRPLTAPEQPAPESASEAAPESAPEPVVAPEPVPEPKTEPEPPVPVLDEAVKIIGPLCIDLELYNVFLNEADEWSRRLTQSLSEWALTPDHPLPEGVSAWAHSLAGGAGTVGYLDLSRLSRALEHALDRTAEAQAAGALASAADANCLTQAAEEARTLLHQFAAGFLREPQPATVEALQALALAVPAPVPAPMAPTAADKQEPAAAMDEPEPSAEASARDAETPDVGIPEPEPEPAAPTVAEPAPAIDRIDADLFAVFEDEALQLLPRLGSALRQWVARPDNASARAEVLRNLHTFKGSARLAGALRLGDMAHRLESAVLALPDIPAATADVAALQASLDALAARFEQLRTVYAAAPAGPALPAVDGVALHAPERPAVTKAEPLPSDAAGTSLATVRVRADTLDRLMAQTGDVLISRTRLESDMRTLRQSFKDMSGNIERLREQLRDLEMQTESQMQSRLAQNRDTESRFDPLEFDRYTRVQELTRLLAESVNDVATVQHHLQRSVEAAEGNLAAQARQTRELQRDLLRTRLVAFDSLAERLHRVVRQAAEAAGKPVLLDLVGADLEVDRAVLERLTPALEHLLRNAVVHGIEPPAERLRAGKPEQGRIEVRLQQSGHDLALTLNDDGAGLNLARIREQAVARGAHPSGAPFTEADAVRCIFAPGLSTATEVSEVAGRGIGLDVVRNEVLGLGGRIEFLPAEGGGAGFRLVVPLSTAVTQVVMLRVGDFTFGVPVPWVANVRRALAPELTAAYVSGQWRDGDTLMPFFWAGALLALSTESTDPQAHEARHWPVLEFYSAGQRVAWHVDEVLGQQEVVVKPLGAQLARLPGLAGATVLASGSVALIYNPVALALLYGDAARGWVRGQRSQSDARLGAAASARAGGAAGAAVQAPLVLVVDDSITVRRVTQRLLKREGYRVALAADGVQALERLREEAPVVVLCDIEMPRMDGFELVRQLRSEARWADLPVVMITSRLADKHREHAQSMGVDHYLGKPYSEEALLALVEGYARLAPQPVPPSTPQPMPTLPG